MGMVDRFSRMGGGMTIKGDVPEGTALYDIAQSLMDGMTVEAYTDDHGDYRIQIHRGTDDYTVYRL